MVIIVLVLPSVTAITVSNVVRPAHLTRDNAALIHWDTDSYSVGTLEYGTTTSYGSQVGRTEAVRTHMYDLQNLQAGTTYYYRINVVGTDGSIDSSTGSFTTENALTVVNIPAQHLTSRMTLNQANTRYVLQGDITAETSAFFIQGNNIILDLNGFTVTYETFQNFPNPIGTPNGFFENGFTGWTLSPTNSWVLAADGTKPIEGDWHADLVEPPIDGTSITSEWSYLPPNTYSTATYEMGLANYFAPGESPLIRWELEEEGVGIINTYQSNSSWFKENKFTTDANGGRYRQIITIVDWRGPGISYYNGISLDLFSIRPRENEGIQTSGTDIIIRNGKVVQGRGKGGRSHSLYLEGTRVIADSLEVESYGVEAYSIHFRAGADSAGLNNIVTSQPPRKYSRHLISAPFGATYQSGTYWYNNTVNSGTNAAKIWGAINVGGNAAKYISYNDFNIKTQTTNHHAIVCWMCDQTRIHNNKITADPGQGLLMSGDNPAITDVKVYDNNITTLSQEPNLEYGTLSMDGIRLNDYGSNGCNNVWINGNTITAVGDFNDKYKIGYSGQVSNGIITACSAGNVEVSNNVIRAIKIDPASTTSALEPSSNTGVTTVFKNNIIESNNILVMFGGYKGVNIGLTFENNTFVRGANPLDYYTIGSRSGPSDIANMQFVDTQFQGGASFDVSQVKIDSSSNPYDFMIKYTLELTVVDVSGNPLPASVVEIRDLSNNLVYTGVTDSNGKLSSLLNQKMMYGGAYGAGHPSQETYYTPHTLKIIKSGYATYEQPLNMDSKKATIVALASTGPGILLYSTMNTLAEIQSPTEYVNLMSPPSAALATSGTGTIDLESTTRGGGVQIAASTLGNEQILFAGNNIDLGDLVGDGGRIDWWMKFNEDPHNQINQWVFRVHNSDNVKYPGVDRWLAVETLGSIPNYLWIRMYSNDPNSWDDSFDVWTDWDYWYNNVNEGEWHLYTLTWRNNGPGKSEMHLFIDGQNSGCSNCNAYNGYVPPADGVGIFKWGGLLSSTSLNLSLDEIWSFSRWDHGYSPGTYATITRNDEIIQTKPGNNELLFTDSPSFEFIPFINAYENDVCVSGSGGFTCELFVDGSSLGSFQTCHDTLTTFDSPIQLSILPDTHSWYVTCDGITSTTRSFSIDSSGYTECEDGVVDYSCRTVSDNCPGSRICQGRTWGICVDDPADECPASGIGGNYVFQNGKYGYDGQEDAVIKYYSWEPAQEDTTYDFATIRGLNNKNLMKFDVSQITPGTTVIFANLTLTEYGGGSWADGNVSIAKILKPWDSLSVTWNCLNDVANDGCGAGETPWEVSGALGSTDAEPQYDKQFAARSGKFSFDLTPWVQEWVNNPSTNYGFVLVNVDTAASIEIAHEDYGTLADRPILTVKTDTQPVNVTLVYDLDGVNGINIVDLVMLSGSFGIETGQPNFLPQGDYNRDGKISILDLITHINNWD